MIADETIMLNATPWICMTTKPWPVMEIAAGEAKKKKIRSAL